MTVPPLETMTVVYSIKDQKSFDGQWKNIHERFLAEPVEGYCVTAISRDHEIHRLQLIEEALERYELEHDVACDAIGTLISCADLPNWSWEKFEAGEYD